MTSKLTRERLQEIAEDGFLKHGESKELARMALAEKASEPVILYRERNPYNGLTTGWQELTENEFSFLKENAGENAEFLTLYRHAQPVPVVPPHAEFSPAVITSCHECGSESLTWDTAVVSNTSVQNGRLKLSDVSGLFYLGCDECSETLARVDATEIAAYLNACRAAMLQAGNCRENVNSSTNNCRKIPETSTNRSREHFISLCNEFWNWSEMDEVCAEDRGYELRMEWDGKVFKHPVTQALWRMYQAAPQEVK